MVETTSREHQLKVLNNIKRNFVGELTIPNIDAFNQDLNFYQFLISQQEGCARHLGNVCVTAEKKTNKRVFLITIENQCPLSKEYAVHLRREIYNTFGLSQNVSKLSNEICETDSRSFILENLSEKFLKISHQEFEIVDDSNILLLKDLLKNSENSKYSVSDTEEYMKLSGKNMIETKDSMSETAGSDKGFSTKPSSTKLLSSQTHLSNSIEYYVNEKRVQDAFFICDLSAIKKQYQKWKDLLPRITPFYAVKCNNDPRILQTLVNLGTNFDCASMEEIRTMLSYGVPPSQIIYANPCKQPTHIKFARDNGIDLMTFDNYEELEKVKECFPSARLVIRIHVDDSKSVCQLGIKFGVRLGKTLGLLKEAKRLRLNVVGVSFHVGSGCQDASAYYDAIRRAHEVFKEGEQVGYSFSLLDIGGGFPGFALENEVTFEDVTKVINSTLNTYFSNSNIKVIAEPGRYFSANAFTLATNIISKRSICDGDDKNFMYYLNDGVYGSFNCLIFDHAILPNPQYLIKNDYTGYMTYYTQEELDRSVHESSLWGPTCDSMDCLTKSIKIPQLSVGDWIIFENMGAYTLVAASKFNGIPKAKVFYLNSVTTYEKTISVNIEDVRTALIEDNFYS